MLESLRLRTVTDKTTTSPMLAVATLARPLIPFVKEALKRSAVLVWCNPNDAESLERELVHGLVRDENIIKENSTWLDELD